MKKFSYEARDQATNKIIKSSLQADSESAAGRLLVKQGYTPLKIEETKDGLSILSAITGRITTKDKLVFIRQLATLVGAGLPLTQSFHTVYEQTENKKLQVVIGEIMAAIEGGKSLSQSFGTHPELFNEVFTSLVEAGEASGTLDTALNRISLQQEKDAAAISKIKGAMTYPLIVLVVIFGVLAFMLLSVVPQIQTLYKDMHKELPFISQLMVDAAAGLTKFWWIALAVIGLTVFFLNRYRKTESGINIKDKMKLKTPLIKNLFEKLYMARFSRTGQTLLASGVSMLDMLKISSKAINNVHIEKAIVRASEKVKGGKALSFALEGEEMFARLVPQMIKIGEQSGKIDEMMGKVADVYENDLDQEIKNISTLIEPILMVIMAGFAGIMVAAILLPVYSLVSNVKF
jgi:type IV pilus assembly protein PilC